MSGGRIALARPAVGAEELAAVERVLASGRLTQGPEVEGFESELAAAMGRKHAVALSSGTAALQLALWAQGIGAGDDVIVPSFTFPASANAIEAMGARAVLADVDPRTWNLTVETLEAALTPQTRAIMPVDIFGLPADVKPMRELAQRRGLVIVQDAACSLGGACPDGQPPGAFADAACLSFHPRKVITTGEGGALVTDDPDIAKRVRILRSHGMEAGKFERVGLNYRLSEIHAAIGRVQLGKLGALLEDRARKVARYRERLAAEGVLAIGLALQETTGRGRHPYQTLAARLPSAMGRRARAGAPEAPHFSDEGESPAKRDLLLKRMAEEQIELAIATHAVHRTPAYLGRAHPREVPESDALYARGISLPLWFQMPDEAIDRVARELAKGIAASLSSPSG